MPAADLYLGTSSTLHRLDPRVKLAGLVALFATCLAFTHPAYVAGVAACMLLTAAAGKALANLWRARLLLGLLFLFAALLWAVFSQGGTPLAPGWPRIISRESVLYGLGIGLRLATMVAAGLVFLSVTRVEEFSRALQRLSVPFVVTFAFSTAFRLVPALLSSAAGKRTSLVQLRLGAADWGVPALCAALLAACVWLRWSGPGLVSGLRQRQRRGEMPHLAEAIRGRQRL